MVQGFDFKRQAAIRIALIIGLILLYSVCGAHSWVRIGSNRHHVVSTAGAEVGVKEKGGNNKGERVGEYLAATGLKQGHPWCAAFVAWVFDQCGISHKVTAWSPSATPVYNKVWQRGARNNDTPLPGDVFSLYYSSLGRIGHTGYVVEWGDKWVITIEGNTNGEGSREGDGVYRKKRLVSTIYRVSRWIR